MFRFVSSLEALVPASITGAEGGTGADSNAGALVLEQIRSSVAVFEHQLQVEARAREESNMILAQRIAKINNLLNEKGILKQKTNMIHDANSMLYNCTVCMEKQRIMCLEPCGHMATCASCTNA